MMFFAFSQARYYGNVCISMALDEGFLSFLFVLVSFAPSVEGAGKVVHVCLACVSKV